MPSYHDIIRKEAKYNEIVTDFDFTADGYGKFENAVIQMDDGSIFCSMELKTEISDFFQSISSIRRDAISVFSTNLGDDWELFFEWRKTKSPINYVSHEESMTGSAREIERRRSIDFLSGENLVSHIFITLIYRPHSKSFMLTREVFREFLRKADEMQAMFSNIGCNSSILNGNQLLEYIKFSLDLTEQNISASGRNISDSLLTAKYDMRRIPMEIENGKKLKLQTFSITDLPDSTFTDCLGFCTYLNFEFRLCIKYRSMSVSKSEERIQHRKKAYRNSLFSITQYMRKEVSHSNIEDDYSHGALYGKMQCDKALDIINRKSLSAGDMQISIELFGSDEEKLETDAAMMKREMQKNGLLLMEERLGNTLCYLSCVTASRRYHRQLFVLSRNFADTLHLSSPGHGSPKSDLLIKRTGCETPLIYARNLDGSAYCFSLAGEHSEKGHTFITGPTGSGKSVLLSLIIAQWRKFPDVRTVLIDRDMSGLEIISDNGGRIFYPGNDSTRFQPLRSPAKNKKKCLEFIKAACFAAGVEFGPSSRALASDALDMLSGGTETITAFRAIIKGLDKSSPLIDVLQPFSSDGEHGKLFDGNDDDFCNITDVIMIETNKLLKNWISGSNVAIPAFIYLFSLLEEKFDDGIPTILIIDEGWKILKHEIFSTYMEEWIKTLRKKNVDIVFSITNLADIIDTSIAETILSNCETKIFFKDPNATGDIQSANYAKAGLNENQTKLISHLPDFCPLVIQGDKNAVVDFRCQSQMEYLVTTDAKKRKYLCTD